MAIDYNSRIDRLKNRRRGLDQTLSLESYAYDSVLQESLKEIEKHKYERESWENRSNTAIVKYALGAMEEVDSKYTDISIKTAERIENQLYDRLKNKGIYTRYRLQGSVPLNIHIKGISDVDLLVIDDSLFTYDAYGPKASSYHPATNSNINVLKRLREESVQSLGDAFPKVKVDISGSKSIKLTGGSLARDVDVVPSTWNNTYAYQISDKEEDRGINIYDSANQKSTFNLPFKHISLIKTKCLNNKGSLRKSIRLCKNLKADLIAEGTKIYLSSYDLASLMYHVRDIDLFDASSHDLLVLYMTQQHFDKLYRNKEYTLSLDTPDSTRKIIDNEDKFRSLLFLSCALDELVALVCDSLGVSKENLKYVSV
ncbi:hypothetical protein MMP71_11135 [Acinetobacter dispersus]|uniref:hypothetical protein n=1 Tax=Acinetobacter dispersus TaxID=70348 RepID=UPI001F4BBED7|nr:hypothetical protein [Acinetobacter dispersus]